MDAERPVTRILRLLEVLQARGRVGGPELADRLGVDPRTVRRCVARLQELGIPVEADRGRAGGYRLRPGYRLPPLMLDDDEALAVTLGLLAVRRLGMLPGGRGADGALAKLDRVLPPRLRERVRGTEGTLSLAAEAPPREPVRDGVLLALSDAAREGRTVAIDHRSWRGEAGQRDVDPYGLVLLHGRWYVAARDHRRGAVRVFRADRIAAVHRSVGRFARPPGFDALAHVERSLARVPWRWPVTVELDLPADEVRRRVPASAGEVEARGAGSVLRVRAERLDGVARLLAGLGCELTVVEPAELRAELAALATRLARAAAG